jgi:tetratricopeptide (TPR) repeat protein
VDDAMGVLSAGLKRRPRDTVLLNDLGMCCMLKKDYPAAREYFAQATALDGDNARYRTNMAAATAMLGRYDDALAMYMEVLPPADAHYNLSVICEARKDYPRAVREYGEAVRLAEASQTFPPPAAATRPVRGSGPAAEATGSTENIP